MSAAAPSRRMATAIIAHAPSTEIVAIPVRVAIVANRL
jgi:hypothetical protein